MGWVPMITPQKKERGPKPMKMTQILKWTKMVNLLIKNHGRLAGLIP